MLRLVLMPLFGGFIATAEITAVLWAINKTGWANADMVRAVGALFTKSYDNALRIGMVVHFVSGVVMAGLYFHILSILMLPNLVAEIIGGGFFGFAHGLVVSWGIIRFAERHPVKEFQEADYQVAIAHVVGHVTYGMVIGAFFGAMRMAGFDVTPAISL